ncbi:hypothetical protein A2276_03865 [candidate division WOR-1 bacterium RIFOXYA12_FULL_43_27]|uniref:DUF502 domain-containing protein n=1 Tax=candidate division WOR-1 bacterium RIFOXYC2_FULL_46_14 TaxID=1802587 RepID=A0A1F4U772_UNCSA|nr:MAG: hypothetical protein A2276_03865 [candidate division WOR-1 bacterium RIFOXYA12_FULL_43_27]OGC19170.1 MAG: hypothetical protein A2292_00470 [candidate division WOR-1 bacterium RIFOXYB2_FULL_46_45]OGC30159.1 MAG: hypothetical protein A2232_00470 [candidate division WOR-1 bacterium RIFOXYA2_FULL_46_56]OGC40761.1 MAG: hypothetical protein A2438_00475 [candidate division WOR-1 bacterium RIFOXYC2_FULL_46_14]
MDKFWNNLSSNFFRGLIILLPLLVTLWLIVLIFNFSDSILGTFLTILLGHHVPGLGLLVTIVIVLLAGYFATYLIGARMFKLGEELLYRVPIVKSIYSAAKQINDILFTHGETSEKFRHVCMVEYPRKGIYSIGFITSDAALEIESKAKTKLINVFVPNTPTPATGFLILVPAEDVIMLDMKTDEAFRYIVSAGVLQSQKPQEHLGTTN